MRIDGLEDLTKREYFAAMALQGMQANNFINDHQYQQTPEIIAKNAVTQADSLIEALNK